MLYSTCCRRVFDWKHKLWRSGMSVRVVRRVFDIVIRTYDTVDWRLLSATRRVRSWQSAADIISNWFTVLWYEIFRNIDVLVFVNCTKKKRTRLSHTGIRHCDESTLWLMAHVWGKMLLLAGVMDLQLGNSPFREESVIYMSYKRRRWKGRQKGQLPRAIGT